MIKEVLIFSIVKKTGSAEWVRIEMRSSTEKIWQTSSNFSERVDTKDTVVGEEEGEEGIPLHVPLQIFNSHSTLAYGIPLEKCVKS